VVVYYCLDSTESSIAPLGSLQCIARATPTLNSWFRCPDNTISWKRELASAGTAPLPFVTIVAVPELEFLTPLSPLRGRLFPFDVDGVLGSPLTTRKQVPFKYLFALLARFPSRRQEGE